MAFISLFLSFFLGLSIIHILYPRQQWHPIFTSSLALGLGLGTSSLIVFINFVIFNRLNTLFVIIFHLSINATLIWLTRSLIIQFIKNFLHSLKKEDYFFIGIMILYCLLLVTKNIVYPHGGWDAWAFWNTKSQFLFYGESQWRHIFLPVDKFNPSYPLLLPMMYVWTWIFQKQSSIMGPIIIANTFTIILPVMLSYGLKTLYNKKSTLLSGLLLCSIPMYQLQGISQYADIIVAFYVLSALLLLLLNQRSKVISPYYLIALILSCLSYTKSEGSALGILILGITIVTALSQRFYKKHLIIIFLIAFTPIIVHKTLFFPGNDRFINGLISSTAPTSWERVQFTLVFLGKEFINYYWLGVFILCLLGVLISWKEAFAKSVRIIPLYLTMYITMVILYYSINTYYEVVWWMGTSIKRIVLTCLPVMILWCFASILTKEEKLK